VIARGSTNAMLSVERFTTPQPNQAALNATGRRYLAGLRGKLVAVGSMRCDGYAAKVPGEAPNAVRISKQRAAIVCAALRRLGLDAPAKVVGHGDARPVAATNHAPSGQERNRRVEITITRSRRSSDDLHGVHAATGSAPGPWDVSGRVLERSRLPQTTAPPARITAAHVNAVV
jgi:hypothetical protein